MHDRDLRARIAHQVRKEDRTESRSFHRNLRAQAALALKAHVKRLYQACPGKEEVLSAISIEVREEEAGEVFFGVLDLDRLGKLSFRPAKKDIRLFRPQEGKVLPAITVQVPRGKPPAEGARIGNLKALARLRPAAGSPQDDDQLLRVAVVSKVGAAVPVQVLKEKVEDPLFGQERLLFETGIGGDFVDVVVLDRLRLGAGQLLRGLLQEKVDGGAAVVHQSYIDQAIAVDIEASKARRALVHLEHFDAAEAKNGAEGLRRNRRRCLRAGLFRAPLRAREGQEKSYGKQDQESMAHDVSPQCEPKSRSREHTPSGLPGGLCGSDSSRSDKN